MRNTPKVALLLILMLMAGCTGIPEGIKPVSGFELQRYLGTWYEIARLDHSFERGMSQVSATYSLREDDADVRVLNRGYSAADDAWQEAEGKARFVGSTDVGHLKVSFFGPFYGSYIIFELDSADYQYAFVTGASRSQLWLLSRTPTISPELLARFEARADELGFATAELIYVEQADVVTPSTPD
jgi:apolipoprotein D and lipocalin family protein